MVRPVASAQLPQLPLPRYTNTPYTIVMLCLGNICRSPTAEVVLTSRLRQAGQAERVRVISAGTGDWHVGDAMDARAASVLSAAGYDPTVHQAKHFDASWFPRADVVLAMDRGNLRTALALAPDDETRRRVMLYRSFDPEPGNLEVPDPWYGDRAAYTGVLDIIQRTSETLVAMLTELVATP